DLIVTQAQCDVCAVRYAEVVDLVECDDSLRGTPIVALNPTSLAEILEDIRRVGAAAGATTAAEQLIAQLSDRIERVRMGAAKIPLEQRRRVVCIEWLEPLMVAANWIPELVESAGGKYEMTRAGMHSVYGRWEDVVQYDPELLAIMPCGFDLIR